MEIAMGSIGYSEKAGVLAILHDYRRKFIRDSSHVTREFEELVDAGWHEGARQLLLILL